MKKIGIFVVILCAIGLLFFVTRPKSTAATKAVTVSEVVRKDFIESISSSGKTHAKNQADLRFLSSGRLTWVGVSKGDTVKRGQHIASLDSRDVLAQLKKAKLTLDKEKNSFDTATSITYPYTSSKDAASDLDRRALQNIEGALEQVKLDVELRQLAVEYSTLYSPISGIVTQIDTPQIGVNITPATADFIIIDPESIVFQANIDEVDLGRLTIGQEADISLDAYPGETFKGTVSYIAYSSELSAGGATIFPVEITMTSTKTFRIGLNGDVAVIVKKTKDALTVPKEAIHDSDNKKFVYKKSNEKYTKVFVETGATNSTDTVILKGLHAGESVVTKGIANLPKGL